MTNQTFDRLLTVAVPVEFSPSWSNGTGYLDNAVEGDDTVEVTHAVVSFTDNFGRKAVVISTPLGLTVVFQRYSKAPDNQVLVQNSAPEVEQALPDTFDFTSRITEPKMARFCEWAARLWIDQGDHDKARILSPWTVV